MFQNIIDKIRAIILLTSKLSFVKPNDFFYTVGSHCTFTGT